jgi:hypothetical protein
MIKNEGMNFRNNKENQKWFPITHGFPLSSYVLFYFPPLILVSEKLTYFLKINYSGDHPIANK